MINEQLHKSPAALDRVKHRTLKLDRNARDMSALKKFNAFFVTVGEFAEACKDFPVVWVTAGNGANGKPQVAPLALFGLHNQENLCIEGDEWRVRYVPALLRFYPFAVARTSPTEMVLCIDEAWQGLGHEVGDPLFGADGEPTELTVNINKQLQELEVDIERTRQVGERLGELGLLREMRFDATLPDGSKIGVDGFLTIDEEKLAKLGDAQALELARNGLLGIIHAHQISLTNMTRLAEWQVARSGQGTPAATPVA
ncbi:SapC family protein [Ideonella sp. A 288]|uniref:SapC family protein n=1 Tax=Ideonella sp. A 288 TaxID=1962181 RepID=UPI0013031691|nr:SapC family protein [Ideonella sp. A 288]